LRRDLVLGSAPAGRARAVAQALATEFEVRRLPASARREQVWLDTADARLDRSGISLRQTGRGVGRELVLDLPGEPSMTAAAPTTTWPAPVESVAATEIRRRLAAVVGVRALVPIWATQTRSTELRLLDDQAKTVVKVVIEDSVLTDPAAQPTALPLVVTFTALRGYDRERRLAERVVRTACGDVVDAVTREVLAGLSRGVCAVYRGQLVASFDYGRVTPRPRA